MKETLPSNSRPRSFLQHKWCATWTRVGIDVSSLLCNTDYKLLWPNTLTLPQPCQIHRGPCGCSAAVSRHHHSGFRRDLWSSMPINIMILTRLLCVSRSVQTELSGWDVYSNCAAICKGKACSPSIGVGAQSLTHTHVFYHYHFSL